MSETALIVGAGPGLSAALARACARAGMTVHLAARRPQKLAELAGGIDAGVHACDAGDPDAVAALFRAVPVPDLVLYNPSKRVRGPVAELDPAAVREALDITAYGGFLVGREAARAMQARGSGTILFTGASASVKGFAQSAPFAMGKFALRGLAQSMARELAPKNIHVAHVVIDGGIGTPDDPRAQARGEDGMLHPDAIAQTMMHLHRQHRSAWAWEIELRPWTESF